MYMCIALDSSPRGSPLRKMCIFAWGQSSRANRHENLHGPRQVFIPFGDGAIRGSPNF